MVFAIQFAVSSPLPPFVLYIYWKLQINTLATPQIHPSNPLWLLPSDHSNIFGIDWFGNAWNFSPHSWSLQNNQNKIDGNKIFRVWQEIFFKLHSSQLIFIAFNSTFNIFQIITCPINSETIFAFSPMQMSIEINSKSNNLHSGLYRKQKPLFASLIQHQIIKIKIPMVPCKKSQ